MPIRCRRISITFGAGIMVVRASFRGVFPPNSGFVTRLYTTISFEPFILQLGLSCYEADISLGISIQFTDRTFEIGLSAGGGAQILSPNVTSH